MEGPAKKSLPSFVKLIIIVRGRSVSQKGRTSWSWFQEGPSVTPDYSGYCLLTNDR
jgi:hypothetical protein